MENKSMNLRDESGAIMVIAMVLLAMLTIIGFMSINRTTTELEIAKNEVLYRRNFLRADAVNVIALGVLEELSDTNPTAIENFTPNWLYNERLAPMDFTDPNEWDINSTDGSGINCQEVTGFTRNGVFDTHYAVVARRVPGGSVVMGRPLLVTQYEVYSRYASEDGQAIVHSAYRLRN